MATRTRRRTLALLASVVLVTAFPSGVAAAPHPNPTAAYVALQPAVAAAGGQVVPLINSGQVYQGVTFEGIPDGLGIVPVGNGSKRIDIYVAFEQSHVPFGGFADLEDSSVHRVRLDIATKQIIDLKEVLPPSAGFIRFCSAFMAGPEHGFSNYTFFVNEESNDWLEVLPGQPYGADPSISPYRQAGYAVWLDTKTRRYDEIEKAGRHNHENTVFVPGGWRDLVSLSGDDTFTAPSSQLYMMTNENARDLMNDDGQLWAFQVTATHAGPLADPYDPQNNANDLLEIAEGQTWAGRFIRVPNDVALGDTADPPQTALENWSNANNVFQFVRVEDIAYDPDNPRTVYFTDTGTSRLAEDVSTGRLVRLASGGVTSDGTIFRMVLNANNPRVVDEFSIVETASDIGMRAPDNLDVGHSSIMVQEDASDAKIWHYNLDAAARVWTHVATVTHPTSPSSGESSGIVDVSTWLGAGWWALDVQSHVNQYVEPGTFTYTHPSTGITDTYQKRREDGQLLLMLIPGS